MVVEEGRGRVEGAAPLQGEFIPRTHPMGMDRHPFDGFWPILGDVAEK